MEKYHHLGHQGNFLSIGYKLRLFVFVIENVQAFKKQGIINGKLMLAAWHNI